MADTLLANELKHQIQQAQKEIANGSPNSPFLRTWIAHLEKHLAKERQRMKDKTWKSK